MNLTALKNPRLWIALAASVAGVLLSQGVLTEGSTLASVAGWVLQVLGIGVGGAQLKQEQLAAKYQLDLTDKEPQS